jgi:hypothetical protein
MSKTIDHGYTVVRDAEACVQRLSGDKLLKAQERLAVSNVGDKTPAATTPGKTLTGEKVEPSLGTQEKQKRSKLKDREHLKEGLYVVRAAEVSPKRVDAIWADDKGGSFGAWRTYDDCRRAGSRQESNSNGNGCSRFNARVLAVR